MDQYFETNKKLWDAKTPIHLTSDFYQLEAFKAGKNVLNSIELEGLGSVAGKSMLHLQCHFGQDSMCWARAGAKVTGIDFSPEAIKTGKALSAELNIPVDFVESDVYGLKEQLSGTFDIVFTSYGTITWLPDVDKWAGIVNHFLAPGGTFYIADFHPFLYSFDFDTKQIAFPYFNTGEAFYDTELGTYADPDADIKREEYFWVHSIAETMTALLNQGLQVEAFKEFDYSPYDSFPNMKERAPGQYVFGDFPVAIPHIYSIKVTKPT